MLVLTRKAQQQINIGNNIVVTVLHVKGQAVRVGIEAPSDVRVVRGEIADKPPKPSKVRSADADRVEPQAAQCATTGANAASEFSSPRRLPPIDGESAGLFPYLHRRAGRTLSPASPRREMSTSSSSRLRMSVCG